MPSYTPPTVTVKRAGNNAYRIDDTSHAIHLLATPLSSSEYLLRNLSQQPNGLIIDRQAVRLAKIDKFTPLQIGSLRTTLGDILKNPGDVAVRPSHPLTAYAKDYHLQPGKIHLAGASTETECDIPLPAPRLAWHLFRLQPDQDSWQLASVHQNKRQTRCSAHTFNQGETMLVGPYHLRFGTAGHLTVQIAKADRLVIRNLEVRHPTNRYQSLLQNLSLVVQAGEFLGIIGPSGAGKSTLLKAIRNLIPIDNGDIHLSGRDTRQQPDTLKEIGFVPQDDVVVPELTVEENLRYAATFKLPADWPAAARLAKVEELLHKLRLTERRNTLCNKISGGQRKRVNLALELLLEPTFLLADEVCSGLSALDADNILHHLRDIADSGKGVLLTIHSPDIEALDLMDTLLVLDVGGLIAYYGPAREALRYFSNTQGSSPYKSPKLIFDVLEKRTAHDSGDRVTSPEQWWEIYRNSTYHYRYLETRLTEEADHE